MEFLTDPITWWISPFLEYDFMRSSLVAGLLAAVTLALVGTWVVLRGMSFLGDALAHGVLPGIAIAIVIGANTDIGTTIGAFAAAIIMVAGVHVVRSHSPLSDDTSIGILFVGFLALAIVIVSSQSGSYFGDLRRFLFGSILGVNSADLWRLSAAALVTVTAMTAFHRAFLVTTFDESLAKVLNLHPKLTNALLMVLLSIAIVSSFNVVGNLLVFAFLVAPPAAAAMVMNRIITIMISASAIAATSVALGLLISYHHSTAASATMALISVLFFVVALTFRQYCLACWPRNLHRLRRRLLRTIPMAGRRTQQTNEIAQKTIKTR